MARRLVLALAALAPLLALGAPARAASGPVDVVKAVDGRRGVVVLLHGGGWRASTAATMATVKPVADWFNAQGWSTRTLAQQAGQTGLDEVVKDLRRLRVAVRGTPLCVYGESSGAQLAQLAAAELGGALDCVVAMQGPQWLEGDGSPGGTYVRELATVAFGAANLRRLSPVTIAPTVPASTRFLLLDSLADPLIASWQADWFAYFNAQTTVVHAEPGSLPWGHSTISPADAARVQDAMLALLRAEEAGPVGLAPAR